MTLVLPDKEKLCHHTGFEKKCLALVGGGTCQRWRFLPGVDVFTGEQRQQWGCIDDLVLQLQGEANRQANASHDLQIDMRELALRPEYRRERIAKAASEELQIEAPK